jgi:hypothetical protein
MERAAAGTQTAPGTGRPAGPGDEFGRPAEPCDLRCSAAELTA